MLLCTLSEEYALEAMCLPSIFNSDHGDAGVGAIIVPLWWSRLFENSILIQMIKLYIYIIYIY